MSAVVVHYRPFKQREHSPPPESAADEIMSVRFLAHAGEEQAARQRLPRVGGSRADNNSGGFGGA